MGTARKAEADFQKLASRRFQSPSAKFSVTHPSGLAVYCSDGRFTRAVEDLLAALGGARTEDDRPDVLCLPGGPALLDYRSAPGLLAAETVKEALRFLVDGHGLTSVALIAHEGCGYYKKRYPRLPATEVVKVQVEDLIAARRVVESERPRLAVTTWVAEVRGENVTFREVEK